jgi:curli biogenesis system outer membrane secretion channel CsgG
VILNGKGGHFSMRKFLCVSLILLLGLMIGVSSVSAQPKKRVAVFTFADKSEHRGYWWGGKSPGDGMADMLTTTLVKSGKYSVIERQEIARVLQEQRLGQSGMVTPQSAAQVAKLLGVELAIMGSITEFGYAKKDQGVRIKGFRVGSKSQKATVAVDVRFVNTTTGEILAAESVRKEKSSSGLSFSSPELAFKDQSNFDNSIVGKVTRDAIDQIVKLVDKQIKSVPWEGKIILVKGSTIYMKPGSDGGIQIGDTFSVYRKGEALIDPDTGLELGSVDEKVGTVQVTQIVANGKAAQVVMKMGSGLQKGDSVRLK